MIKKHVKNLYITKLPEKMESKYKILYPLSHSNNSCVYLLSEKSGNEKVVVKVLYADRQMRKLAKALSKLSGEYILKPIEYFVNDNLIYVLYEYHTPLNEIIINTPLYLKDIICIGIDMCRALLCLHENNIFHFDMSAGNIFQSKNCDVEDGKYMLGDYSNAIFFSSDSEAINDISKLLPDKNICDCRLLMIFLLTLLNDGEMVTEICKPMKEKLPENVLSLFYFTEINFENENEILVQLCKNLEEIKDSDDVLNSQYCIKIQDRNHDLIAKKTIPIKIKNDAKKNNAEAFTGVKKYFPYVALLICGLFFIFSFYKFVAGNLNDNEKNIKYISENDKQTNIDNKDFIFDISNMQIKSFSEDILLRNKSENKFDDLSDITILYANSNDILSLSGIGGYVNIRELYLSDNKLTDIKEIKNLEKVEVLVLSNNNIRDIKILEKLKSLVFVDLSGNSELKNTYVLGKLSNLQILVLTDTGISNDEINMLKEKLPDCEIIG